MTLISIHVIKEKIVISESTSIDDKNGNKYYDNYVFY